MGRDVLAIKARYGVNIVFCEGEAFWFDPSINTIVLGTVIPFGQLPLAIAHEMNHAEYQATGKVTPVTSSREAYIAGRNEEETVSVTREVAILRELRRIVPETREVAEIARDPGMPYEAHRSAYAAVIRRARAERQGK